MRECEELKSELEMRTREIENLRANEGDGKEKERQVELAKARQEANELRREKNGQAGVWRSKVS